MNAASSLTSRSAAPLVAIVGPTASGKSALAVWLAERLNGEIVCCDSTQVYRHFDIGTAKPSSEERRGIAHHLLDLVEPGEVFTAGDYRRVAELVLNDLCARGRLPILTVGTGLYLRALLEGLADVPTRSEELRARLAARGQARSPGHLHRILRKLDPEAAAHIAPRDHPKLIRAIEVCLLSGRRITELHRSGRARLENFLPVKVGLLPARDALYGRIRERVEAMLRNGWLDEVGGLVARGIPSTAKPFQFIGYAQLRAHREGQLTLEDAKAGIQQATRRYAKRQITWFRRESNVCWFEGFGDSPEIRAAVLEHVQDRLRELSVARAADRESV